MDTVERRLRCWSRSAANVHTRNRERRLPRAIPALEKVLAISDRSPAVLGVLTRAYAHAGRRADALRLVEELKQRKQRGYVPAGAFVNAYLGLGDNEEALAWLEKAHAEHSNIVQWMKVQKVLQLGKHAKQNFQ